ncbi:MAG: hypothetical protein QOD41_1116 [Cryptosporangiaceae bacterium]|nr:hypothetical protein [Cryptosporangiaceae bacterium]
MTHAPALGIRVAVQRSNSGAASERLPDRPVRFCGHG